MEDMQRFSIGNVVGDFFNDIVFPLGGGLLTAVSGAAAERLNNEILGRPAAVPSPNPAQNVDATDLSGRNGAEQGIPAQTGVTLSTTQIAVGGIAGVGIILVLILVAR